MISILNAIAVLLFLFALPYLIAIWKNRQITFQCLRSQRIAVEQVPDHLHDVFESVITELEEYGFQVVGYYLVEQGNIENGMDWRVLLQHDAQRTYAGLGIRKPPDSSNPVSVTFLTLFTDDYLYLTQSDPLLHIFSQSPQEMSQYLGAVSLQAQWEGHQHRLKELEPKTPQRLTPEAFSATWEAHSRKVVERLVQQKEVYWIQPGERYRLTLWTTVKAVFKTASSQKQGKFASPSQNAAREPAGTDAAIALEVEEFHRLQQQRKLGSRRHKSWWLLGSLALFIASYAALFKPQTLFIFVAVLLLHEGGHVLAMKLFGYRDAAMLFIPFLGALATARKDNATLTEKVWISLAGPLPGLVLGIGLAIATSLGDSEPFAKMAWVREATWMLIFLNLFNLLPVYPLDGGQVADLLLFSRNPYLGVLFKSIGVGLLALLGLQKPLMLAFAVVIGLTIPTSFRLAKLNAKFRQDLRSIPTTNRTELVQFIFSQFQQSPYNTLPFTKKYGLAVGLLDSHQEHSAQWTTRVGLAGIYLGSLLAGLAGVAIALIPNWAILTHALHSYASRAWINPQKQMQQKIEDANQSLRANPKNLEAYAQRGRAKLFLKDPNGALADANQFLQLDPNAANGYHLRGAVRSQMKDVKGAEADFAKAQHLMMRQRVQDLNLTLAKDPKNVRAYIGRADAKVELKDYKGAIADSTQALQLDSQNIWARLTRGNALLGLKDYGGAIADASQMIRTDPAFAEAYVLRSKARQQLGDTAGAKFDAQTANRLYSLQEEVED